jgi:hypothetical protein
MNNKPEVLRRVEEQTHKSYGERRGGISRPVLPPIFDNVAICMACGKEKYVNTCGFCEDCWVTYAHVRKPRVSGGEP